MPQTVTFTVEDNAELSHFLKNGREISGTHSITSGSVFLCDTSGGGFTITLPIAANNKNRVITIKKISADGNTLTIDGFSAETIDGATTQAITTQYDSLTVWCDGDEWFIIQ